MTGDDSARTHLEHVASDRDVPQARVPAQHPGFRHVCVHGLVVEAAPPGDVKFKEAEAVGVGYRVAQLVLECVQRSRSTYSCEEPTGPVHHPIEHDRDSNEVNAVHNNSRSSMVICTVSTIKCFIVCR